MWRRKRYLQKRQSGLKATLPFLVEERRIGGKKKYEVTENK
jgi:hypothetical protein